MFKVGDKVRCIRKEFDNETVGKIYTVKSIGLCYSLDFQVEADDNGFVNGYRFKNFKLVRWNFMFKVGDKVKCIQESDFAGKLGEILTVNSITTTGDLIFKEYLRDWAADPKRFELVEENITLEQLVKRANDGLKALQKIKENYKKEIECSDRYHPWKFGYEFPEHMEVRIKPQHSFEPFTVGSNWLVELEGDMIHVGCQKFEASPFMKALQALNSGTHTHQCGSEKYKVLNSTRTGVRYSSSGEYNISWEDSVRIVAALQKAGVK